MTTIAYIGSFGRSWNTETHIARDAEALGCTVHRIEERDLARSLEGGPRFEIPTTDVDLYLYTKTVGLPPVAASLWRLLEQEGIRTASFHLDLYRGLARGSEVLSDPFWTTGTVFTADGDPGTQAELELLGINHRWMPAAVASDEAIEVAPWPIVENVGEVVFVGSHRGYHPEYGFRLDLVDGFRRHFGARFAAYGATGGEIRGLDLNRLYQSPGRVVLGDSLVLPDHRNYTSDRIFETLGRGGALAYPRVPGLEDLGFVEFEHLRYYEPYDLDGALTVVESMLSAPEECRAMALRGQAFVRENHTYRHRVAAMLREVGLEVPA